MTEEAVILLVEDNPADVRLAQEALRRGGIVNGLHVVRDGEEALAFLGRRGPHADAPRPDLVLLDLNLPRVDGLEVLRRARADAALAGVAFVVLSTADEEADRYAEAGACCVVPKPIAVDALLRAVRRCDHLGVALVRRGPEG